jgi:hypothetical protein
MAWLKKDGNTVISTEASDEMQLAINTIDELYQKNLNRHATKDELIAMVRFCSGDVMSNVVRFGEPTELRAKKVIPVKPTKRRRGRPRKEQADA